MLGVEIDKNKCIGCGLCEDHLPEVFSLGLFHASVKSERLEPHQTGTALIAAQDCPFKAISIVVN
jgi:ferredoxin